MTVARLTFNLVHKFASPLTPPSINDERPLAVVFLRLLEVGGVAFSFPDVQLQAGFASDAPCIRVFLPQSFASPLTPPSINDERPLAVVFLRLLEVGGVAFSFPDVQLQAGFASDAPCIRVFLPQSFASPLTPPSINDERPLAVVFLRLLEVGGVEPPS